MSSNPLVPSFRYPFESEIAALPEEHQQVHRNQWNAITDLYQGFYQTAADVKTLKAGTTTAAASTTTNVTTSSETTIITSNTVGFINNQSGQNTYTTAQSDYGAFIVLSDTSAIAVSLSVGPGIQTPWFATFFNLNTGVATLTPVSGTINGAGSFALAANSAVTVSFDGTNFYCNPAIILPQNTPAVAHQWIDAYNSTTGAFTQTQPAFTDISGQITTAQLPSSGLSVTIVTAQLTPTGAQGSMTFTSGLLTASTPAT